MRKAAVLLLSLAVSACGANHEAERAAAADMERRALRARAAEEAGRRETIERLERIASVHAAISAGYAASMTAASEREAAALAEAAATPGGPSPCGAWVAQPNVCLDPAGEPAVELRLCQLGAKGGAVTLRAEFRTTPAGIDATAYRSVSISGEGAQNAPTTPDELNRTGYVSEPADFYRGEGRYPVTWDFETKTFRFQWGEDVARKVWEPPFRVECGV